MAPRRILIIGGSTRAAADSVRRAGWHPICADLFADLDLRMTAEVIDVRNYPHSLPDDVAHVRADGWFYCGALENHPEILERMMVPNASYGPLLGTPPQTVRLVRDPKWLEETLRTAGLKTLAVVDQSFPPRPDGSWLQKPLASAGGRSIRVWNAEAVAIPFAEPHYFQRKVCGLGISAVFRTENQVIEWLGASHQLETEDSSTPPSNYAYCGSVGHVKHVPFDVRPAHQPPRFRLFTQRFDSPKNHDGIRVRGSAVYQENIQKQLTRIAKTLTKNAPGLHGLIGLDFRLHGTDVLLTEVNPRYTASIEVLELASGRSLLNHNAEHSTPQTIRSRPKIVQKQILYAKRTEVMPDLSRFLTLDDLWRTTRIADIPIPGTVVDAGWPICTVITGGENFSSVIHEDMDQLIAQIRDAISGALQHGDDNGPRAGTRYDRKS